MNFYELIQSRYSVRAYKPDVVEDEKLQLVLEAARLAPTAANRQPFRLVVVHTAGRQAELAPIYRRDWVLQAPILIFVCGITSQAWVRKDGAPYVNVDAAIVMDHVILMATELGLGTCWIAAFNAGEARRILGLPEGVEPVVMTPLGYPAVEAHPKERKPLSDLVVYEHW